MFAHRMLKIIYILFVMPLLFGVQAAPGGTAVARILPQVNYIAVRTSSQANFSAAPTRGAAPLQVQFTNTSSGNYNTSQWDFGDGITNTMTSPIHTYTTPGVYSVTLTIFGAGGTDSTSKTNFITVHKLTTWRNYTTNRNVTALAA